MGELQYRHQTMENKREYSHREYIALPKYLKYQVGIPLRRNYKGSIKNTNMLYYLKKITEVIFFSLPYETNTLL